MGVPAEKQRKPLPGAPTRPRGRPRSRSGSDEGGKRTQSPGTKQEETEGFADEEYKPDKPTPRKQQFKKRKITGRRSSRTKSPDVEADALFDLTNPKSELAYIDLRKLFCSPHAWEVLSVEERQRIIAKLPSQEYVDKATISASDGEGGHAGPLPNFDVLRNDDNFRHDVARFQTSLSLGQFESDYLQSAHEVHEMRSLGFYDDYIVSHFKETWGTELPTGNNDSLGSDGKSPDEGIDKGTKESVTDTPPKKTEFAGETIEYEPTIGSELDEDEAETVEMVEMIHMKGTQNNTTCYGRETSQKHVEDVLPRQEDEEGEDRPPVEYDTNAPPGEIKEDQPMAESTHTTDDQQCPQDPAACKESNESASAGCIHVKTKEEEEEDQTMDDGDSTQNNEQDKMQAATEEGQDQEMGIGCGGSS